MVGTVVVAVQRRSVRCRTYQKMSALAPSSTREIRACGGGSTKVSIKICASAARVTGLSGEPGGAQRLQGVASHGGGDLEGVSDGGTETPCDVIASFEGDAKAVGGDPRGAAVLRVLRGAGELQDFPTLWHLAQPLLFAEGIRLVLLSVEVLQDSSSFLQLAPPLHSPATQFEPLYARRLKVSNGTNAACAKE